MTADTHSPSDLSSKRYWLLLLLLYGLHLLTVLYVFPPSVVWAQLPYGGGDYQTHFHQTLRLSQEFAESGRLWTYEPRFLAGHPMGLYFDVDNKAHFFFSYGLSKLGVHLATAYNLFAVLSALLVPLVILWSARLFEVNRRGQLVAIGLTTPIYFLDTAARFFTTAGMISYVMSAHVSILVLALFMRMIRAGERTSTRAGWMYFGGLVILLPLAHLIHVWAFAILVGPLIFMYLRAARRLRWLVHCQVLTLVLAVLALNAYWLLPALQHTDLLTQSHKLGQAKPLFFFLDLLEILPFAPPATVQTTLFRYIALAGAAVVTYRWYRAKDPRGVPLLAILGWLFFLTYISAYLPLFGLTEPYRFILALTFAAVMVCGCFFGDLFSLGALRAAYGQAARPLLLLALVLLIPQVARQVLASAPELIPTPEPLSPNLDPPPWARHTSPIKEPDFTLRQKNVPRDFRQMASYLRSHCKEAGRILVEPWELGEYLGWATDLHIIGGFPDRRMVFESSNIFREVPDHKRYWGKAFKAYLARYNIRYVLIHMPLFPMLEGKQDAMRIVARLGPYRLYRANHQGNWFIRGSGRVRVRLGQIALEQIVPAKDSQSVAIRFHHLRTLRCKPNCRIEKERIADSAASFIRIIGTPRLASRVTLEHSP